MEVIWCRFSPLVVDPGTTLSVTLEAMVDGTPSAVRLALDPSGTELSLTDSGGGLYTVSLGIADVTNGFDARCVNRNLVGFLHLLDEETVEYRVNVFIDILTPEVPTVDIHLIGATVQWSNHLVNICDPGFFTSFSISDITNIFYSHFEDDYDFLNVIYYRSNLENRHYLSAKLEADGIGPARPDQTALYGSAGRLLGISVFPIASFFDAASPGYSHEMGHQWVNFLHIVPFDPSIPHWPLSDLAAGIIGWGKGRNTQGLSFNFRLVPDGINYLLVSLDEPKKFTDLSLYLMGLVPPSEVDVHFVFDDQDQEPTMGGTLAGPVTTVSIDDIIASLGARVPSHPHARQLFRVATIIVSEDGLLSESVMRLYDWLAARGAATEVLPYSSGRVSGETKPFYLATGKKGRLDMGINRRILVDASRDGGVWWYPQNSPFDETMTHQGQDLAAHLRTIGHQVTVLPRSLSPGVITDELLSRYDLVIRTVGLGTYEPSEIDTYHLHVNTGGGLLLLADHGQPDSLALSFGLRIEGINRWVRRLSRYTPHPLVAGVGSLRYSAGGGVTDLPEGAEIVGCLNWVSYLDINENGRRDPGEPFGPGVLGVMKYGFGRIVFCGDTNLWLSVPQPLVRNALCWLGGA